MSSQRPQDRYRHPRRTTEPAWWVVGPEWATQRLRQPGWLLLPLRAFLGVTFVYAALQKLANPGFFDASSPTSVQHQMQAIAPTSPIGPLVSVSLHTGFLPGLLIAVAELAVGIATLVGLKARFAAVGGMFLALMFFLTVSWNTTPYYYGADIVFVFAWTPFVSLGAGNVLSLDAWVAGRATHAGFAVREPRAETVRLRERRALLTAGVVAVFAGLTSAVLGRLAGGTTTPAASSLSGRGSNNGQPGTRPRHSRTRASNQPPQAGQSSAPAGMTKIGAATDVPVGQAGQFRDPASASPAWMVRLARDRFVAFSAVCTHAGCTVQYDGGNRQFVCPCHGGTFSAQTGQVLAGPPPTPLPAIPVRLVDGQLYVK